MQQGIKNSKILQFVRSESFHLLLGWELHCVVYGEGPGLLRLQLQSPLNVVAAVQLGIRGRGSLLLFANHRLHQSHLT